MPNPRDVNIDIVGHDKTDKATRSAARNLDGLERRLSTLEKSTRKASAASQDMGRKLDGQRTKLEKFGKELGKAAETLVKIGGSAATATAGLGALQPVIIGLVTTLAPATAALGVFGAVAGTALSGIFEASGKNDDLFERIRLLRETARVQKQRGDDEGAEKSLKAAAKASAELRARYNLLDPAQLKAVQSLDKLKNSWEQFVEKNTPRVVEDLARAFEFLNRQIPKLQPLFDAGADAVERFLGFIERKEKDGTIDRFVTWLTTNAGPAFDTVADAIDTSWEALKTAWSWWGQLSTAVYAAVTEIKAWVLGMQLSWFQTLAQMYSATAEFVRNAERALAAIPGTSEKTKQAMLQAAGSLDAAAQKAREKAGEIQGAINSLHGVDIPINIKYKVYGAPNGSLVPDWYGKHQGGEGGFQPLGPSKFAAGNDFQFAEPGGGRTMAPTPITVSAPDVAVSVTIPGLAQVLTGLVRTEVGKAMGTQAFRAQSRRAFG